MLHTLLLSYRLGMLGSEQKEEQQGGDGLQQGAKEMPRGKQL